jgi:ribosomal-protein-alanine N-acetyltransferase
MPIEPPHAAMLAAIHAACFAEAWDAEAMESLLAMPGVFGFLAVNDLPQGFILCRRAADEVEVLTLAVLPAVRRRRIAANLLDRARRTARQQGVACLFLEVGVDNEAARQLYAGLGFRPVGRRPRYYGDGADALVLRGDV